MDKKIEVCTAILKPTEGQHFTSEQVRGFFGYRFIDDSEFHHHSKLNYHYPLIQYKMLGNSIMVLGLLDYAKVLYKRIQPIQKIILPKGVLNIQNIQLDLSKKEITKGDFNYQFLSPWIALNEVNYRHFSSRDKAEQKAELERILTGNILSFLKGVKIYADYKILVSIDNWKFIRVQAHGNYFQAATGAFSANISLPAYIGLGKSVSKGFGMITNDFGNQ